jgi:hypothetical protein
MVYYGGLQADQSQVEAQQTMLRPMLLLRHGKTMSLNTSEQKSFFTLTLPEGRQHQRLRSVR